MNLYLQLRSFRTTKNLWCLWCPVLQTFVNYFPKQIFYSRLKRSCSGTFRKNQKIKKKKKKKKHKIFGIIWADILEATYKKLLPDILLNFTECYPKSSPSQSWSVSSSIFLAQLWSMKRYRLSTEFIAFISSVSSFMFMLSKFSLIRLSVTLLTRTPVSRPRPHAIRIYNRKYYYEYFRGSLVGI